MMSKLKKYIFAIFDLLPAPIANLFGIGFREEAGFKRYFFNTSWMFLGQIASMVVAFFVGAYVARYLGPKNYGTMNFIISFTGLFGFLAGFGIDSILNRELVKYPEKKETLIGNGLWIKLIGGLLVVLAANLSAAFLLDEPFTRLLIFLFSLTFLIHAFSAINMYFQAQVQAEKNIRVQLMVMAMTTVLKLLVIYFHKGVAWFIAIFAFEATAAAIIILLFYFRQKNKINWRIDWLVIKDLLRDSWPLMFITVAMTIYFKIDQTFIKFMLDDTAVGLYAVAVKLSEIWYFIPNIIAASLFPALVNARKNDQASYFKRLGHLYRLMIVLAVCIALPCFLLAGFIVKFLFGPAYMDAVLPFRIYIWSGVPIFLMAAVTQYLIVENYTKIYLAGSVMGAIINIALNLVFIPKYGIVGSAVATLVAYWVPVVVTLFFVRTREQWGLIFAKSFEKPV